MANMLRRTSSGDPMSGDPAQWRNTLVEVVESYFRSKKVGQPAIQLPSEITLRLQNQSGGDLAQYSVVSLSTKLVIPEGTASSFYGKLIFETAAPAASTPFAIYQKPAADGKIARAMMSGISPCKVSVSSTTHLYADVSAGTYTNLVSQSPQGPAEILHKATPPSTQLDGGINDVVTTMTVDANTLWPAAPFVVTIGTEDILVGATSGTNNVTWSSLTRGYNSTVAAVHSDNDAVAFKSGTLWCLVRFGYPGFGYSSTWTPTLTNSANLTASTAYECQYSRLGNLVTFSGMVAVTPTTPATLTQLGISLPVASNFSHRSHLGGTACGVDGVGNEVALMCADDTNDRMLMEWTPPIGSNGKYSFQGSYRVI